MLTNTRTPFPFQNKSRLNAKADQARPSCDLYRILVKSDQNKLQRVSGPPYRIVLVWAGIQRFSAGKIRRARPINGRGHYEGGTSGMPPASSGDGDGRCSNR